MGDTTALTTIGQTTYSFEQLPGETDDDYRLFAEFANSDHMTAHKFITARQLGGAVTAIARKNYWTYRKDQYAQWLTVQRRHAWLTVLDSYLGEVKDRLAYHAQRIKAAAEAEQASGTTSGAFEKAVISANKDAELALRIAQVLGGDTGIKINIANIANAGSEKRSTIKDMAASWGDPAQPVLEGELVAS